MFDKRIIDILKKAGWYKGRKIDISEQIKKLELCGFEVFDKAKEFLQEFDNLKLEDIFYIDGKKHINYTVFNVNRFTDVLLNETNQERRKNKKRRYISSNSKEKNIPIGIMSGGEMFLFVTESGKIVTDIILIGNSIEEGVSNIIKNNSLDFLDENMRKLYRK